MRKWLSYVGAVILVGLAIYFFSLGDATVTIALATISLIAAITLWIMASDKNYNASIDLIKRVDNVGSITIEEVFHALEDLETPIGRPWIGHIVTISQPCIIWGPSATGEIIYAYKTKATGSIYLTLALEGIEGAKESEDSQAMQAVASNIDEEKLDYKELICFRYNCASLLEDLCREIDIYVREHRIASLPGRGSLNGTLYRFDEDFKLTGQRFHVCDMDQKPIYEVNGTFPLKTFSIKEIAGDREVFSMKKRIFHILPHYDFYMNGEKYASFRKKIDLIHTTFTMQTQDGLLEMRSVNTTIGDNYQVKMNGEIIGNISEKLNLTLHNIVFDNFILFVREEKHTVLIAALATMAAREMARGRADERESSD